MCIPSSCRFVTFVHVLLPMRVRGKTAPAPGCSPDNSNKIITASGFASGKKCICTDAFCNSLLRFCSEILVGRRLSDVTSCGRRRGGHADAEMAAEAGAWCEPARTAARRGRGADAPWVCSQVEAIMASIVSNVEGWPRSRPQSPGVCQPARTCGESSIYRL